MFLNGAQEFQVTGQKHFKFLAKHKEKVIFNQ